MKLVPSRIPRLRRRRACRGGFTLVEVLVVVAIVTVAMGLMTNTIVTVGKLAPVNRETARAMDAARSVAEELRSVPFDELWARYNEDPDDDPGGAGTAPGPAFFVAALEPDPEDADGLVGEIVLPSAAGELREDAVDARLGFPRDLNGDLAVDALDHSADYEILPFVVRLRWTGRNGPRTLELCTAVARP